MFDTFTVAKSEIRCRKHHQCAGCEARFSYIMVRKIQEKNKYEWLAQRRARKAAEWAWNHGSDVHPCPQCGTVQLEMSAEQTWPLLSGAAWTACFSIGVALIVAIPGIPEGIDVRYFAAFAMAAAAVAAFLAVVAVRRNLNTNRQRHLAIATDRVRKALLRFDQRSAQTTVRTIGGIGSIKACRIGAALLVAAPPLFLIPLLLPSVFRWPSNTTCTPKFVGVGETAHFEFPDSIPSVGGYWSGKARGTAKVEGAQPRSVSIEIRSKDDDWKMRPAPTDEPYVRNAKLWADVTFGDQPDLAGCDVRLDLQIDVDYPRYNILKGDPRPYSKQQETVSHTTIIALAPARAGAKLARTWWITASVGMALAVSAAICFHVGQKIVRKQSRLIQTEPLTNSMANYNMLGD